ncbi:hypothetical protein [Bifidobacterium oedipodis]|uniref:Uncharacterized protein n=1 Tax=Bifidobacterium oedipodis TaxID=2675322 RepID=A0A7Y0EQP6_9BIFI|nr:hypothetical protein [Bifidobacterium sp. DSM 109957]NMM93566.1 hypothetical protein [Bifidobacterium sp. DSM 109957]
MDRTPISERFPELADIDSKTDDQQLTAYRSVLNALQHELDDNRG